MLTVDQPLTIDELAARVGLTVRTIRFYAGRGMLPPPTLRGRVGLYGPAHVARLDLIRDLQQQGFTLTAVERFLARLPADASAEEIALQRALIAPWADEEGEEVDRDTLDRRAGRRLSGDDVDRLVALGFVEPLGGDGNGNGGDGAGEGARDGAGGRYRIVSATVFGFGVEALHLSLPLELLAAARDVISRHAAAMAHELQRLFHEAVLRPYGEHGRPAQERERLARTMAVLPAVTTRGVVHGFQHAVNQAIRDALAGAPAAPADPASG